MPFADEYVVSAHPPLPLHSKVPRPWALDTYSTVVLGVMESNARRDAHRTNDNYQGLCNILTIAQ